MAYLHASAVQVATAEEAIVLVPEEGIFIAMQTILQPGDHFVVACPGVMIYLFCLPFDWLLSIYISTVMVADS